MLKRKLTDRYRILRSLIFGAVISVLFMPILATKEVITTAIASTLCSIF